MTNLDRMFLDTNVLLENFEDYSSAPFLISSETLMELENLKTDRRKTDTVRMAACGTIKWLADNDDKYNVIFYCDSVEKKIWDMELNADVPDIRICGCAWMATQIFFDDHVVFVTHDISCRNIASKLFGLDVEWFREKEEEIQYTGFKEIVMTDEDMAYFYEHQNENIYNLLTNEYIIVKNQADEIVDSYRWDGEKYQMIYKKPVKSTFFDKLKPKDIYQTLAIDSIMSNTITAISAPPGAGKSLISLMCAMNLIESGKYDHLVILYNPSKARGAADMGFYSGDAIEKGLQNSIGQMLTTKFGDRFGVELLIQQGKLKIVSLADCRGMEIRDNEILYITECQNTTVDLIKLALSRVSSGAKVIIEGDWNTQVDSHLFEGKNNGLKRAIKVLSGKEEFGYVQLQNVWRSKIAELCELL